VKVVKLRLQGFKSFVDATEAPIHPGLTGVVGPNGCGKSNLLEAVRWAMGETSAKAMRGADMDDVIFAGSASRPARPFAEVVLTLDNTTRAAPVGFNDADRIEVSRRITREAGSVFRVNGREARARDVRMLFADAATGAHSPALVRQGRIAELIAAKPAARRAILEEAAGVSGLHQRRHEAELKLDAAARNLAHVDEVLEGLAERLARLARQAKEAARYRGIAEALRRAERALLLARWREADAARAAADAALTEASREAARAQAAAAAAASARAAAEAALPPLREEATVAAAVAQRRALEREAFTARAAAAAEAAQAAAQRLAQLRTDAGREAQLDADAAESLGRLDAEIRELEAAQAGHGAALARAQDAAGAASAALAGAEAAHDAAAEAAARVAAQAAAAERRAAETAAAAQRAARAAAEAAAAAQALADGLPALADRAARAATAAEAAAAAVAAAEARCAEAEAARGATQGAEAAARLAAAEADGAAAALRAEVAGVEKLLARGEGKGARLLDAVRAAPGWEAALGAALGADLDHPPATNAGGWTETPPLPVAAPPAGAEPLSPHVAAPAALARRLAFVAVVAPEAGDALQPALGPGWRLVSRRGDLWRWDGLRLRAGEAGNPAAARLEQLNRLDALRAALAEAATAAAAAREAHAEARARDSEAAQADEAARAARRRAEAAAAEVARAAAQAAAALSLAEGRLETARAAEAARAEDAASAARDAEAAAAARAEAGDPAAARAEADALRSALAQARERAQTARAALEDLRRREAGRERRLAAATKERASWATRRASAEKRRAELDARLAAVAAAIVRLDGARSEADRRARAAGDALAAAEAQGSAAAETARAAETQAAAARELRARREALMEAEAARAAEAEARLREAEPGGPEAAIAALGPDAPADPEAAEIGVARLRRQRDALGAVNLRAEEDAAEVEAERDRLAAEKADLEAAIAKLREGVAALNREGRARLTAAFGEVDATFRGLFTHLFGGGEARLALVESDDPLEAGLEIMAMPPGKKLATLSLLSGGEQTLTALALIFAVFLVNPAPLCVLDEVDAPLDDANVGRFCDLLDEMTRRTDTRFLVITHHAVTMSRMDRLYGVTMVEPGVSQLVSVDLALAAEMATG
jgi:chromosome segregation protein